MPITTGALTHSPRPSHSQKSRSFTPLMPAIAKMGARRPAMWRPMKTMTLPRFWNISSMRIRRDGVISQRSGRRVMAAGPSRRAIRKMVVSPMITPIAQATSAPTIGNFAAMNEHSRRQQHDVLGNWQSQSSDNRARAPRVQSSRATTRGRGHPALRLRSRSPPQTRQGRAPAEPQKKNLKIFLARRSARS